MIMDGEIMKNLLKKLILPALIVFAIVCASPVANAADYPFTYEVRDDGVVIVSCDTSYEGALVIPDTIEGKAVVSISNSAFLGAEGITSLTLPKSLKTIGTSAFEGCVSLKELTIPNSTNSVGDSAFASCASLEKVNLGSGISKISQSMFEGCTKLNNVILPENVKSIGDYAFSCCDSLETLTIYPYVTSIGSYAFYDCGSLVKIALPETVTVLNEGIFAECGKLASVSFHDTVTEIKALAFDDCEAIEKAYFTGTVAKWAQIDIDGEGNDYLNDAFLEAKILFKHKHDSTPVVVVKPTCENKGLGNYACECGYAHKGDIPALGHDAEIIPEVSATCTKAGTTSGERCSRCGVILTQPQTIPATGHLEVVDEEVAATCVSEGKTRGSHCKVCGEVFKAQEVVAKKPHNAVVEKFEKATLTTNGEKISVCKDCGNVETKKLYNVSQIAFSTNVYAYTGKVITPKVVVKDSNGNTLVKDTDYSVTYPSGRKAVGKYTVTVTLKGDYSGSKKITFNIINLAKTSSITASSTTKGTLKVTWSKVANATGYRVFVYKSSDSSTRKLVAKVSGTSYTLTKDYNDKALKIGTTYKVAIIAYAEDSNGNLVHAPAGVNKAFKLTPGKATLKASSKSGKVNLSWTNVSGETGYVVYYATSKNGKYTKLATTKANVVKYSKSLTKGKTYYFKVRAYTTVGGSNVYGSYSSVVSCKIK